MVYKGFYKRKATNFTTQEEEVRNEFEATKGKLQNAIHDMHL